MSHDNFELIDEENASVAMSAVRNFQRELFDLFNEKALLVIVIGLYCEFVPTMGDMSAELEWIENTLVPKEHDSSYLHAIASTPLDWNVRSFLKTTFTNLDGPLWCCHLTSL